jgi:hypothetical protein
LKIKLEDRDGLPWTASTSLGWVVLIVALSSGTALVALALYLALWVRSKGRSWLPLVGFGVSAALSIFIFLLHHWHLNSHVQMLTEDLATVVWIASSFSLRHEVRTYYREVEGWDIGIVPWLTFFFSAIYINYCLNPVRLAFFTDKDTIISLNLSSQVDSAKIAK